MSLKVVHVYGMVTFQYPGQSFCYTLKTFPIRCNLPTNYFCLLVWGPNSQVRSVYAAIQLDKLTEQPANYRAFVRQCLSVSPVESRTHFRPIIEAARYRTWSFLTRSVTWIVGSDPTRSMDVCVSSCIGSSLGSGWFHAEGILLPVYKINSFRNYFWIGTGKRA